MKMNYKTLRTSFIALALVASCLATGYAQTEQSAPLAYKPFKEAVAEATSTGRPLMVLGFTDT